MFKNLFPVKRSTQSHSQQQEIVVVLHYSRHCKKCSNEVKRSCEKMKGVTRVVIDDENALATVEGAFDANELVKHIRKRNNKIVTIVEQRDVEKDRDEDCNLSVHSSPRGGYGPYGSSQDDLESFSRYH